MTEIHRKLESHTTKETEITLAASRYFARIHFLNDELDKVIIKEQLSGAQLRTEPRQWTIYISKSDVDKVVDLRDLLSAVIYELRGEEDEPSVSE
jgi:hypothetical protein